MADTERFIHPKYTRLHQEVARRRWRNMMIAAMSNKKFPPEQKQYLEKMRVELDITLAEAGAIVEEYQSKGGNIQLFGDKHQRLELIRDMVSMMLADGAIDERERKLLSRVADKLDITDAQLDGYIEECKQAMTPGEGSQANSHDSSRLSRRIFRRITQNRAEQGTLLESFDNLDQEGRRDLELQVLEELVEKRAPIRSDESSRTLRHRLAYLEDQKVAKVLLDKGVVTEEQLKPFREEQEKHFEENGVAVSFVSRMVKADVLKPALVQAARKKVRAESGEQDTAWTRSTENIDGHALTIEYERVTLDQTFRVSLIRLKGYLDHSTTPLLREIFEEIFEYHDDASRMMILDLSAVEYVSSAGIGEILNARSTVLDRWGDIRFVNVSSEAMEILQLLGVDQVLTICQDVDEALWSFIDLAVIR